LKYSEPWSILRATLCLTFVSLEIPTWVHVWEVSDDAEIEGFALAHSSDCGRCVPVPDCWPGNGRADRNSHHQRTAKNQWRIKNVLRPYSAYNIPVTNRDPGNDGVVNTSDDPAGVSFTYFDYPGAFAGFANQDSEYVNDDSANRKYTSYEFG
jgi:hypothetical protein